MIKRDRRSAPTRLLEGKRKRENRLRMPSILKLSAFAGAKQRTGANQIFEQLVAVEARLLPFLLVVSHIEFSADASCASHDPVVVESSCSAVLMTNFEFAM